MIIVKDLGTRLFAGSKRRFAILKCEFCNKEFEGNIARAKSISCGCRTDLKAHFKHNYSKTRQYQVWADMKDRCNNVKNSRYYLYGGRGITYDTKWEKFEGFWEDMQDGYEDDLTIDRIDSDKGYYKNNCRWVTKQAQTTNRHKIGTFKVREDSTYYRKLHRDKVAEFREVYKSLKRGEKSKYIQQISIDTGMSKHTLKIYFGRKK